MKLKFFYAFGFAVFFLVSAQCLAKDDVITVYADERYPPYEFADTNSSPAGFNVDIIRAVAEAVNLNLKFEMTSWQQVVANMKQGDKNVIASMFESEDRDSYVDFSVPYGVTSYSVFVRKNSEIKKFEDLKGRTALLQKSDIAYEIIRNMNWKKNWNVKLETVENQENALLLLASGKSDFAVVSKLLGYQVINKYNIKNLKTIGSQLRSRNYCIAVTEGNSQLLMQLNEGLRLIKENGEYYKIYRKWFGVAPPNPLKYYGRLALWILISFVTILSAILAWNWSLKKSIKKRTRQLSEELSEREKAEKKLLKYQKQLKDMASEITLTEERERKRIAVGLHDRIGQPLIISKLNLQLLKSNLADDQAIKSIEKVCGFLDKTIQDAKSLTFDMSSPILHELGFNEALEDQVGQLFKDNPQITVKVENKLDPDTIKIETQAMLLRHINELLINIIKHAQASYVDIKLENMDGRLVIKVKDNGIGFDPEKVAFVPNRKGKFGLFSIKEKIELFNGQMDIRSDKNEGTEITLEVPTDSSLTTNQS